MKVRTGSAALVILSFFFLSGCMHRESRVQNFQGTSFELAKFNQIANLGAEKNTVAVETLDGKAANNLIKAYRKGFLPGTTASAPTFIFE